ncbi:MAG: HAMP domain-containing histidine kinase [Acidimicrobiia bacterium]|nr:HAMP domain-containing histidine kinase [Acidimicrobiia bacterium]
MAERRAEKVGRFRRFTGSVRFRVTAVATVAVAGVLAVMAVVSVTAQSRALTGNLDDRITVSADELTVVLEGGTIPSSLSIGAGDEGFAQLVSPDGDVVAASERVAGAPAVISDPTSVSDSTQIRTVNGLPIGEDSEDDFRLLTRPVDVDGSPLVLVTAASLDDVNESVRVLTLTLVVVLPVVLVLFAALIWFVVSRALRPVEAIRAEVVQIGGDQLERRVPVPESEDEIGRLATTMNEMLERIETAHERQRRFVADASHELRSPLTNIRSELEVDLAHPASADPLATHRSVLEETGRLQRLVDDLLYLARSDAGVVPIGSARVDLDEIVLHEATRARSGSGPAIDVTDVSGAQVSGDTDQLRRAVRNLVDNARRHATSAVTVSLHENADTVVLRISDDGEGVPPDQAQRIFERFTRADTARDRDHGGTGLGLAITSDIVGRHGGSVELDDAPGPGATFVVRLPVP